MFTSKLEALTFLKGAIVAASLGLGFSQLCMYFNVDPLGHVRRRADVLQAETMPPDSTITYREMTGYFPLAPKVEWQFETAKEWSEVQRLIEQRLAAEYRLFHVKPELMMLSSHVAGEVQHLEVKLLREELPTLVRCRYSVAHDPAE